MLSRESRFIITFRKVNRYSLCFQLKGDRHNLTLDYTNVLNYVLHLRSN